MVLGLVLGAGDDDGGLGGRQLHDMGRLLGVGGGLLAGAHPVLLVLHRLPGHCGGLLQFQVRTPPGVDLTCHRSDSAFAAPHISIYTAGCLQNYVAFGKNKDVLADSMMPPGSPGYCFAYVSMK